MQNNTQKPKRDWVPVIAILIPLGIIAITGLMRFAALEEDVTLLQHQITLMHDDMNRRFDKVDTEINRRFDKVDTQFDEVNAELSAIRQNHLNHITALHAEKN